MLEWTLMRYFISFLFSSMNNNSQLGLKPQHVIMGLWKFHERVTLDTLIELAQQWSKDEERYTELYVRQTSKDQFGIGFTYTVPEDQDLEGANKKFFHKTTDILKRKFGNDFVGWDFASPVWVIK